MSPAKKQLPSPPTDLFTLDTLLEVERSLADVRQLKSLLKKIVKEAAATLQANIVILYEYRSDLNDVILPPTIEGTLHQPDVLKTRSRVGPHRGAAVFQMLKRPRPVYAVNAAQRWRRQAAASQSFVEREGIASSAAVRLDADQQSVGVLFVNYRERHEFSAEERGLIEWFAAKAAIAIQHAQLVERERRLRRQADTVRDTAATISAADNLSATADKILDAIYRVVKYRKATMQLIHDDTRELLSFRGFDEAGIDPHLLRPISSDPLIARLVERQRPIILRDTKRSRDWEQRPQTATVRSWVGWPLVFAGETIGLITLDHTQPGIYTRALTRILTPLAHQAAMAIKNAQLLSVAQNRIRDLQILNEIAQLMAARLNTADLLEAIAAQVVDKLHCAHCTIFMPEPPTQPQQLVPRVIHGEGRAEIAKRRFALAEGLVGWAYTQQQSIVLADARADARFVPPSRHADRPRSMLVAPLPVGDQVIGVICADQDRYGWFSAADQGLLDTLARQTGIAIQRNTGLEIVRKIGDQINAAQQVDEILPHIVSGAIELTHTTSGVIYLISDDGCQVTHSYKYPPDSFHPAPRMAQSNSSTRRVVARGEMLIFENLETDKRVNPALRGHARSMIALPLKRERRVVGVLYLNDADLHVFTEAECSLLMTLANQAATALHKAQLLAASQQQADRHRALNNVITQLTGTLTEDEILDNVAQLAFAPLDCQQCSVFRLESTHIVVRAAQGGTLKRDLPIGKTFKVGQGVAGWVAEYGQSALVPDTSKDERFDPTWSSPPPPALLVVPIRIDDRVYGVISIEHDHINAFTSDDLQLLETLAQQAGQALRSARRIYELQVLYQTGKLLSSQSDQTALFEALLDAVNDTLKCTYSTLFLADPATGDLVAQVRRGHARELAGLRFPVGQGLAGRVAETRQAMIVPDLDRDPYARPSRTISQGQPHSVLVVPLILFGGNLIGVLSADKTVYNGFSDSDKQLLETIGAQAAIAIENNRLFEEQKQQANELALLHEISANWMILDLQRMLRLIVEGALRLTGADYGILYLLNDEGTRIVRSVGVPEGFTETDAELSVGGLTRQIVESSQPLIIPDTRVEPRVSAIVEQYGIQSFVGQPLMVNTGVIGVLYLNSKSRRQFDDAACKLIATLALQAASALDTARLYERLNRQIVELHQVVREADTQRVLNRVLEGINQLLGEGTSACLSLYHPDTRTYYDYTAAGALKDYLQRMPPRDSGTSAYVITTGQPLYLDDVHNPPTGTPTIRAESIVQGVQSFAALPLRWQDRIVGMLFVNLQKTIHFTDEVKRILELFASQAAIAIVYRQMYENVQRRARYLVALNEVSQQAKDMRDAHPLFKLVVREAQAPLQADRCTLFVLNDEGLLVPLAMMGVDEVHAHLSFAMGEGLAGWVAQEGRAERVPDARQDARFLPDATVQPDRPRAMVLAPLWLEGKVGGVLAADRDSATPFDEDDQRFVETLAVQAGILWRQITLRVQRMEGFRRQQNPYIVGKPIHDPAGFFGRRTIIQRIMNGIHQNNFILHGERRIGKSSMLFQIEHRLNEVSRRSDPYYFVPVWASLQGVAEPEFFNLLIERIAEETRQARGQMTGPRGLTALLKQVVPELEQRQPGRKAQLVLLLDEMDQFMEYSSSTHDRLRSVAQKDIGQHVSLVMAGVTVHRAAHLRTSPWYNLFQAMEIPELDEVDCRQLIVEPVRGYYRYAPAALNLVLARTDFKPYEVQRLGWNAVNVMLLRMRAAGQVLDDAVTGEMDILPADVEAATALVLAENDDEYRLVWAAFDQAQQQALCEAQDADGLIPARLVSADLTARFTPDQLYNLTRHTGGQWRLTYFFSTWLKGLAT